MAQTADSEQTELKTHEVETMDIIDPAMGRKKRPISSPKTGLR